ncbi:hypothetical protein FHS41_000620 [Streptomyces violarus]|uniref:Uncharacterized protein n=1 Tax=Streptomyces violarus TaxID=67380 RepID=A0A7W4ZKN2_9ACTN|nr:hypothetical protein [Streptomyces violarus]
MLNLTVPPGLVLLLRLPSAADLFTDRELMLSDRAGRLVPRCTDSSARPVVQKPPLSP